ncbi:hypothetical protein [Flammeovirga agarivorans]|uniref:Uncharacterized protein n=1 Tax=Flammeovirga agarivorans TaxID=2726742 RepID=A0A7X8SJ68_9BACT|nr:hypothetical protein [Flammeovirga agarivorans]NLR91122.1 hypothetical protein [Flammeovirga agarivorans]
MKKLLFLICFISSFNAWSQNKTVETEAKYFTNWMDKIIHLSVDQKNEMIALRTNYILEKNALKKSKVATTFDRQQLDRDYWKKRDRILTRDQSILLATHLVTSREVEELNHIVALHKDQKQSFYDTYKIVNYTLMKDKKDYGRYSDKYIKTDQSAIARKKEIINDLLIAEQKETYDTYFEDLKKRKNNATFHATEEEDVEIDGYNILEPIGF